MKTGLVPEYRTRAHSLHGIEELAIELGRDLAPILRLAGLSPPQIADPNSDIDYRSMCRLLEACAGHWDCPDFGLRLAKLQNLNFLGPVGLVARQGKTVEDALRSLIAHLAIHSTGFHSFLDEQDLSAGRQARLAFVPKPGSGAERQVVEHSLYVSRNILAALSGVASFKLLRVDFQHAAMPDPASVRRYFECPISYGENISAIYFDAKLLRAPNAVRDTAYAPLIAAYFDKLRPQLEHDLANAIRNTIGSLISTGTCSLASVAHCYRVHPRTLQRRLREQGISFAEILDEYRKALAIELVGRRSMPLVKIADALGYADQSVFNQAFRRWTGTTPTLFGESGMASELCC